MNSMNSTSAFQTFPGDGDYWEQPDSLEPLKEQFQSAIQQVSTFRRETTALVDPDRNLDVLAFLRDEPQYRFDMLTDVTAVHWPQNECPFEVAYLLYSLERNKRLRVKCALGPDPRIASVTELWAAANWLERECFDMFGIRFDGHPELKRILMPDDYEGWPLRKEFPLKR